MAMQRMTKIKGYKKPNQSFNKCKMQVAFDCNINRSSMYNPVIGEKCTNIEGTSATIKFNTCNIDSPSPDLKNTISHLRNLNPLKEKDLACKRVLWPNDDTNLTKSNNNDDDKIPTKNLEDNLSEDEMSSHSEPFSASSDEEYKPESVSDSDSDEHASNNNFNQTSSTKCMDISSENLTDIVVDVNKSTMKKVIDNKKSVVQCKNNAANNLKKGVTAAGIARKYDKKSCCPFCQELVLKFPRHLIRKHRNEKEVEELCSLPPRDSKRLNILTKLRKLGNFQYNCSSLENKEGNIIVKRRSQQARKAEDYLPCHICLGYYAKRNLYMHYKRCHSEEDDTSNRIQKAGRALLPVSRSHASELLAKKILPDLRNDNISEIIRNDRLILLFGSDLALKLCREQHLSSHVRQRMRELARLVEHIQHLDHTFDQLENLFHPQYTELFFKALTNLTQLDVSTGTYMKPSAAIKLRTSLYVCGEILMGLSVEDENKRLNIQHFLAIINLKFKRYCSLAKQTIDESKWNKPVNLPSSENIKKFMVYLDHEQAQLYKRLNSKYNHSTWHRLSKVLLVNILVFNRRRAGEAQMLKVSDFEKRHSIEKNSDLYNMLSDVEKQVSDNYCRVQVRGKLRNGVPILLTNFQVEIIKLLLNNRSKAHVSVTNPYVFGRLNKSFIRATDAIRELTVESGVEEPEKLRSTTLRKQMGTQVQILNLKDNELDDLAGSLGHDIRVHRSFYRLPNHMVQIAKTGKLLVAASQGRIMENQGCTLAEINVNLNDNQCENSNNTVKQTTDEVTTDNESDHITNNGNEMLRNKDGLTDESSSNNKEIKIVMDKDLNDEPSSKNKVARSKARWNTPEKRRLRMKFKQHLKSLKVPGKVECEEAIKNETPLKRRTWTDIKNWVHNTNVTTRRRQKNRKNMPFN